MSMTKIGAFVACGALAVLVLARTHAFPPPATPPEGAQEGIEDDDVVLDSLPDAVISSMEARDRALASLPFDPEAADSPLGPGAIVEELLRWRPGQVVTVAFLGGDPGLHRDIAEATDQITRNCNIRLDFGRDDGTGTYRTWLTSDTDHAADIRVSFDQQGYFSLVGTDSRNVTIGRDRDPVGGRAYQRSLNLGGFDVQRPSNWRGVVRHEFMHALAFHHEHQNPAGPCEDEFRWQDDLGYRLTRDRLGRFIPDANGLRPGIYTYLAGYPNFWPRSRVDHNLRQIRSSTPGIAFSRFDRASVMLYRFPAMFYRNAPSPCAPLGDGEDLSQGDIEGLEFLYPFDQLAIEGIISAQDSAFEVVLELEGIDESVQASVESLSDYLHESAGPD